MGILTYCELCKNIIPRCPQTIKLGKLNAIPDINELICITCKDVIEEQINSLKIKGEFEFKAKKGA